MSRELTSKMQGEISSAGRLGGARRLASWMWLLLFGLLLAACGEPKRLAPPPIDAARRFPSAAAELHVDLYFDATLSMQGFTLTESDSYYQKTVRLLEAAAIAGGPANVTFARFGDEIERLIEREQQLQALSKDFYSDARYNKRTRIERVLARIEPGHLTIIVTDLFQDSGDVNQLSLELKRLLAQGMAVGVLGIRSQYRGTVYDVGSRGIAFRYSSGTEPQRGRPFYLLAIGSHAEIDRYFRVLRDAPEGIGKFPEHHALIISQFLTEQPASFTAAPIRKSSKFSLINQSKVLAARYTGEQLKTFRVRAADREASFNMELEYRPLPEVLEYSTRLVVQLEAWKGESPLAAATRGGNKSNELSLVSNLKAQQALSLQSRLRRTAGALGPVELETRLRADALPGPGIYRYRVVLRPAKYALPRWVADWSMSSDSLAQWRQRPEIFDGSRTFNLTAFLDTLRGALLGVAPPQVAEFNCYILVE